MDESLDSHYNLNDVSVADFWNELVDYIDSADSINNEEFDRNSGKVLQTEPGVSGSGYDSGYECGGVDDAVDAGGYDQPFELGDCFSDYYSDSDCLQSSRANSTDDLKLEDLDLNVDPQRCEVSENDDDSAFRKYGFCQDEENRKVCLYDAAIAANKELAAALQGCQEELNERKLLLEKRIHDLREDIQRLKAYLIREKDQVVKEKGVTKLSFSQFGFPYFKDKDGKPLPVYEKALTLNKIFHFEPTFDVPKPLKMLPKQEDKLKEAVLKDLVRIALDKLASSRENVMTILAEKTVKKLPHKALLSKIESLDKQIEDVGVNPEKWYRNRDVYQFPLIDWKKIALEVFPNHVGYDGAFLRRWWKCHLDPSFCRGDLTEKEIALLKKLTTDCNPEEGIDFQSLATTMADSLKMRKKRHWFQLGQYYQKRVNRKNRNFGWTKEESERLQVYHLKYSTSHSDGQPHKKTRVEWDKIRPHFPGRSVSQMDTYLRRKSASPASSQTKIVATPSKRATVKPKSRGRPMRPETSDLDQKIAALMTPYKSIRQGRRRVSSLPGDGRVNGMVLNAIHQLMPLMDLNNVPREVSDLAAAGVPEKDLGAVEVLLSLPQPTFNSKLKFPANLASLTGLRGLLLTQQEVSDSVNVEIGEGVQESDVQQLCGLGDPNADDKLLKVLETIFGWAGPFIEAAVVDGTEVRGEMGQHFKVYSTQSGDNSP